ncbi:MAG: glycosyltransferase family 39 protein [Alphaproteobacteria bacterium]|nr:glycosyltransferase family 39 protein [Alphaproteobacteria bacterium]
MTKLNPLLVGFCGILLITLWHILTLYTNGVNLFFDEAQYWNWAKNLDFGYYSKPPFIAWAIAATTGVCSDTEPCIRLASPLAHMMTAIALLFIGKKLFSKKAGMWSALIYITLPGVSFSSLLISTDPFLLMFWAWGLFFLIHALEENAWKWWLALGVCFGFGMLSKYAMLFFIPGVLVFLAWEKKLLPALKNIKLWVSFGVGLGFYLPNVYWNYLHSFVSYAHTKDNANLAGSLFHPLQMLEFIGSQFGVFGPILFAVLLVMIVKIRSIKDTNIRFLLSFTLPVLAVMTVEAFLSRANANWAASAYVSATVAVTGWLLANKKDAWVRASFILHIIVAALLYSNAYLWFDNPKLDIMKRAKGWDEAGRQISLLQQENPQILLLADERKILTPLLYYVRPFPETVYKWNPAGRIKDHYDLTTDLNSAIGKDFLVLTRFAPAKDFSCCFEKVTELEPINIAIYPDYSLNLKLYKLENFKGYPK